MPLYSPCHSAPCNGGPGTVTCSECGTTHPADLVALANIAAGYPIPIPAARPHLSLVPPLTEVQEAS